MTRIQSLTFTPAPVRLLAALTAPLVAAAGLAAATPAEAQSRYDSGRYDRHDRYEQRHDRNRNDNSAENALIGAVVGALAGAIIGEGDGRYIAGGAVAGAALGVGGSSSNGDCNYYRGGRCYRNQGHWEREHGINSRDSGYRGDRYDRRQDRRDRYSYDRRW